MIERKILLHIVNIKSHFIDIFVKEDLFPFDLPKNREEINFKLILLNYSSWQHREKLI
jgi:hypothetical protein